MTSGPRIRVAGFGLRGDAGLESLRAALDLAAGGPISALATVAERAEKVRPLALEMGLPLHVTPVNGVVTPTQSVRVQARFGTGSVAEAAALAAAGWGAKLLVKRVATADGMATCAVAEGEGK